MQKRYRIIGRPEMPGKRGHGCRRDAPPLGVAGDHPVSRTCRPLLGGLIGLIKLRADCSDQLLARQGRPLAVGEVPYVFRSLTRRWAGSCRAASFCSPWSEASE